MKIKGLHDFLEKALSNPALCWQSQGVQELGALHVPDQILGEFPALFRGDIHRLWAGWFLGTCVDVDRLAASKVRYPSIYKEVLDFCSLEFGLEYQAKELARALARLTDSEVSRLSSCSSRKAVSTENRQHLVDLADGQPRCWVCGYKFLPEAVENFLEGKQLHSLPAPLLVDMFKPIGLNENDMRIEVDHVHPHSLGGGNEENLRIACGWCNRYKSNHTALYDVSGVDRKANVKGDYYSLPHSLWVVRMLAIVGKSEVSGVDAQHAELTVTIRRRNGKATPPNLKVVSCEERPSWQLQSLDTVRRLIKCKE